MLLAFVVVAITLGVLYFSPTLLAAVLDLDRESPIWRWAERVSWIVTTLGVAVGVMQLGFILHQQRKIAADTARRPDLFVGFMLGADTARPQGSLTTETTIRPTFAPEATYSEPIELEMRSYNQGRRTAHHVLLNFTFSDQIRLAPQAIGASLRNVLGSLVVERREAHHHPNQQTQHVIPIQIPTNTPVIEIFVTVTYDDYPTQERGLIVRVT
jgi:hypothetical protein